MSKSIETNYTSQDYLDRHDSISGAIKTLELAVDDYINTLGEYIAGEGVNERQLENSIEITVDSLQRVYESLDEMDELLENEKMVARIEREEKRGFCDLEENLHKFSEGLYSDIDSFDDLITLLHYVEKDSFKADQNHLQSTETNIEAPTRIISNTEEIEELKNDLNTQYNRLIYSEILARRHTEAEPTFKPEPPIFKMLGDQEHRERINKLNTEFRKKNQS